MTSEGGEQLFGVGNELAFRRVPEVFLQVLFRLLLLALPGLDRGELVMGGGELRIEIQGCLKLLRRRLEFALAAKNHSEVIAGVEQHREELDDLLIRGREVEINHELFAVMLQGPLEVRNR